MTESDRGRAVIVIDGYPTGVREFWPTKTPGRALRPQQDPSKTQRAPGPIAWLAGVSGLQVERLFRHLGFLFFFLSLSFRLSSLVFLLSVFSTVLSTLVLCWASTVYSVFLHIHTCRNGNGKAVDGVKHNVHINVYKTHPTAAPVVVSRPPRLPLCPSSDPGRGSIHETPSTNPTCTKRGQPHSHTLHFQL